MKIQSVVDTTKKIINDKRNELFNNSVSFLKVDVKFCRFSWRGKNYLFDGVEFIDMDVSLSLMGDVVDNVADLPDDVKEQVKNRMIELYDKKFMLNKYSYFRVKEWREKKKDVSSYDVEDGVVVRENLKGPSF